MITPGGVIRQATPSLLAAHLGLSYRPNAGDVLDLVVVGAGPAGLAASSRIENYLGFTSGISGEELTTTAAVQAQKFGARISSPSEIAGLHADGEHVQLTLTDASTIRARAVIVATGAKYRSLPLERWADFEGAGIY